VYFIDKTGKARQLPDQETYDYLVYVLNELNVPCVMSDLQIGHLRGAEIIAVNDWRIMRPKSSEEELRSQLQSSIQAEWELETGSDPPLLVVEIGSLDPIVKVRSVKFQPHKLSDSEISAKYRKIDSYISLKDIKGRSLTPDTPCQVKIELRSNIDRQLIERNRGELGFLSTELEYGDQVVRLLHAL
jgi:hypothetical protein